MRRAAACARCRGSALLTPAHPPAPPSITRQPTSKQKEVEWVDAYHRRVWEALSPRLEGEEEELAWLREATAPL